MLAWEGAGICKGTGGGVTLSFCPKLVHLYPIMAPCLQTWESAAEGLKAACLAVKEHSTLRQCGGSCGSLAAACPSWLATVEASCMSCLLCMCVCRHQVLHRPQSSPLHALLESNTQPTSSTLNPFKAGLFLPRKEFYLRAHGAAQGGSAIAQSWLEPGGIHHTMVSGKNSNPCFLGQAGTGWHCKVATGCSCGGAHSPGAAMLHGRVVRTLFQQYLNINLYRLMVST